MQAQAVLLVVLLMGAGSAFETSLVADRLYGRAYGRFSRALSCTTPRCAVRMTVQAERVRRDVVLRRIGAGGAALLLDNVPIAHAELPPGESMGDGVAQNVRKAASAIPGMGPPDVAFPAGMLGRWSVRRLLVDVEFPQGQAGSEGPTAARLLQQKGAVEQYNARFIQGKGGLTVADRDYNTRSI